MSRNLDSFLPKSERTPMDAGFPIIWVDGSDSSARILNGNNEVLGGVDKSFYRHSIEQSTPGAASHPSLRMLGNRSAFTTSNVNGLLLKNAIVPSVEVTMFFVYDDNDGTLIESDSGDIIVSATAITVGSAAGAAPAKLSDADPHILMVRWDAVSGALVYKIDEDAAVTLDTNTTRITTGIAEPWFLLNTDGQNDGVTGAVGEIIVYGTFLPNFQVNRLGKYLCTKWNGLWSDIT